jgi:hypothetical protein
MFFYQSIKGSDFEKAMLNHYKQNEKWSEVSKDLESLLGETIGVYMAPDNEELHIDPATTAGFKDENLKLFKTDGRLKKNSKKAKKLAEDYASIIRRHGLSNYVPKAFINFSYGVIRTHPKQTMESFFKDERYFVKSSVDFLEHKPFSANSIEPISEIEYEEAYLELIKNRSTESTPK